MSILHSVPEANMARGVFNFSLLQGASVVACSGPLSCGGWPISPVLLPDNDWEEGVQYFMSMLPLLLLLLVL